MIYPPYGKIENKTMTQEDEETIKQNLLLSSKHLGAGIVDIYEYSFTFNEKTQEKTIEEKAFKEKYNATLRKL